MVPMRQRTVWIGLSVLAVLWLVPVGFVAVYDPSPAGAPGPTQRPGLVESILGSREPPYLFLGSGYSKGWSVSTWEGEDEATAERTVVSYRVERGPLDRRTGTFRLAIWCHQDHARYLEGVRLFVTSVDDWSGDDEAIWTQVAEATVERPGAAGVELACEATVPATTTAFRLTEVRGGAPC